MSNQGRSNEVAGAVELPPWWDGATMKLVDYEEAKVLLALGVPVWWDSPVNAVGEKFGWGQSFRHMLVSPTRAVRNWRDPIFYVKKGEKLDG